MKPLILITNDDSIDAKGIHHLVDCVKDMGEIYVVAPDEPHSGQSAAFTPDFPLRVIEHPDYNGAKVRSVTGTPVDCVKLSMHHILPRRPDLLLSGINHGSNAGNSIIYFTECTPYIIDITRRVLADGLPEGVCLNVNFPAKVKIEGIKVVRAAKSHWTEEYQEYVDPHGRPFYWLTGKLLNEEPEATDTDLYWLDRNFATVVPAYADRNAISEIAPVSRILDIK